MYDETARSGLGQFVARRSNGQLLGRHLRLVFGISRRLDSVINGETRLENLSGFHYFRSADANERRVDFSLVDDESNAFDDVAKHVDARSTEEFQFESFDVDVESQFDLRGGKRRRTTNRRNAQPSEQFGLQFRKRFRRRFRR